jgi:hypothetical protein
MIRDIEFSQYHTVDIRMLNAGRLVRTTIAAAAMFGTGSIAQAQSPPPASPPGPSVNDAAPDFSLAGADRYGLLKTPVRLSDYRGRTVVLAFFFQARTKG